MERALLEGEQQIQMEQLDRIKEKIISLERKEANLLAEAASQRAKVWKCHTDYAKALQKKGCLCWIESLNKGIYTNLTENEKSIGLD